MPKFKRVLNSLRTEDAAEKTRKENIPYANLVIRVRRHFDWRIPRIVTPDFLKATNYDNAESYYRDLYQNMGLPLLHSNDYICL